MHKEDRRYQRIFWLLNGIIQAYESNTVTFGVASAAFLAIRTILKLAADKKDNFPRAAEVLERELLARGGFVIRQWASNHKHALDSLSEKIFDLDCAIKGNPISKTLGVTWHSQKDEFIYTVDIVEIEKTITIRSILSRIARIFDPLGLLGPVVSLRKSFYKNVGNLD